MHSRHNTAKIFLAKFSDYRTATICILWSIIPFPCSMFCPSFLRF